MKNGSAAAAREGGAEKRGKEEEDWRNNVQQIECLIEFVNFISFLFLDGWKKANYVFSISFKKKEIYIKRPFILILHLY